MNSDERHHEISQKLDRLLDEVHDIKSRLYGNGQPGLIRTVDRHEQWFRSRLWFERAVIGAFIAVVVPTLLFGFVYVYHVMKSQGH